MEDSAPVQRMDPHSSPRPRLAALSSLVLALGVSRGSYRRRRPRLSSSPPPPPSSRCAPPPAAMPLSQDDPKHVAIKEGIEVGNGLPTLATPDEVGRGGARVLHTTVTYS